LGKGGDVMKKRKTSMEMIIKLVRAITSLLRVLAEILRLFH
jgi:hypothetical protein